MSGGRFAAFLIVVLSIWTAMHLYVFWRLGSIPWVHRRLPPSRCWMLAAVLGLSYVLARFLSAWHWDAFALPLEMIGTTWMGILFLILIVLLVVEVGTLGGQLAVRWVSVLRSGAVVTALILSAIALIQGFRAPVVKDYEVQLPGLSKDRDGLVLVHLSDLHLGSLIGERWLQRLITQVESLRPDLVVVTGDLVDGNVAHVEPLIPVLKKLRAPLGVWAVTGNHEFYAGLERSLVILDEAGWTVLRDRNVEVALGLVLAGVDDLTARQQWRLAGQPIQQALDHRRLGATILLSHSPWQVEAAAQAGAGLMLSGHTHAGQIWPFTYLVQHRYPRIAGRYHVDGMTLIVSRGTGTWGPRMRLWHPGEIIRIRLRAGA